MEGARKRLTPAELRAEQRKRAQQGSEIQPKSGGESTERLPAGFQAAPQVPKKRNPFEKQTLNQVERVLSSGSGFFIPEFLRPHSAAAAKTPINGRRAEKLEGDEEDEEGEDEGEGELQVDELDMTASDLEDNGPGINRNEESRGLGEKEGPKVRFLSLDEILEDTDFKTFRKAENEDKGTKKRPLSPSDSLEGQEDGEEEKEEEGGKSRGETEPPNAELTRSPEKKQKLNPEPSEAEMYFSPKVKRELPDKSLLTVLMEHHQRNSVKSLLGADDAELRDAVFLLEGAVQQDDNKKKRRGPFPSLQTDWTPKRAILFSSPTSFLWCNKLCDAARADVVSTLDRKAPLESLAPEVQLAACLGHWCHPETPYAPSQVQHLQRVLLKAADSLTRIEQDDITHHEKLWRNWTQAFESLQHQFFNDPEGYFYLHTAKYSVLFQHNPAMQEVRATISRSSKGTRQVLKDRGVVFQMPLFDLKEESLPDSDTEEGKEERREIQEDLHFFTSLNPRKTRVRGQKREVSEASVRSMLLITGAEFVRKLCRFLCPGREVVDFPMLLAPFAFHHGVLSLVDITQNEAVQRTNAQGGTEVLHCLRLSGDLLPQSLSHLLKLFATTQGGHFKAQLRARPRCHPLNVPGESFQHHWEDLRVVECHEGAYQFISTE